MDLYGCFIVNEQNTLFLTGVEDIYTDEEIEQVFSANGNMENELQDRVLIE